MARYRSWLTHLTAFVAGAAIAGPFAFAYGHTEKGIEAGDWLNLPNSVVGAIIGALLTYSLQPKPITRGGRSAVKGALRELRDAAAATNKPDPASIRDEAALSVALSTAGRLTAGADRYQYARALTPPEETVRGWIDIDPLVQEIKSAYRNADRALPDAYAAHGADFMRSHLTEVKARFGEPLQAAIDAAM